MGSGLVYSTNLLFVEIEQQLPNEKNIKQDNFDVAFSGNSFTYYK
jgi:hypothetical protein